MLPASSSTSLTGSSMQSSRLAMVRWLSHVERADAVHLVAEEVESQRVGSARREQVDDAAAHGVVAAVGHRLDAAVAEVHQPAHQLLRIEPAHRGGWSASAPASSAAGGTFCRAAETVVSRMRGPFPSALPASTGPAGRARRCGGSTTSAVGETRS